MYQLPDASEVTVALAFSYQSTGLQIGATTQRPIRRLYFTAQSGEAALLKLLC